MGAFKNIVFQIQDEIELGELTFRQIAEKFDVPLSTVDLIHGELMQQYMDEQLI